jgi:hypothetical protein
MSFEKCTEIMTKCFNTLHKDPDQRYSDRQKVEKLLKALKCQDAELLAAKAVIDQQFPRDYIGACGYFSSQVARIHGPAQLEYRNSRNKKRGIYAIDSRSQRGGRARGLPATAAEGAVVAEEAANSRVMLSMALTCPTPTAISPHKNGRP